MNDVQLCDEMKSQFEKKLKENQQNRCKTPINLITMCESAKGLINLKVCFLVLHLVFVKFKYLTLLLKYIDFEIIFE